MGPSEQAFPGQAMGTECARAPCHPGARAPGKPSVAGEQPCGGGRTALRRRRDPQLGQWDVRRRARGPQVVCFQSPYLYVMI